MSHRDTPWRGVLVVIVILALIGVIGWYGMTEDEMEARTGAWRCVASLRGVSCRCALFGPYDIFVEHDQAEVPRCPGK